MEKRPSQNDTWTELVVQLRQVLQEERLSLLEAQRLFEEAPDCPLSADDLSALVADVLRRQTERWHATAGSVIRELQFTADTLPLHPAELTGTQVICPGSDLVTNINSSSVDTRRLTFPRLSGDLISRQSLTDPIVFDVVPGFDELDGPQVRRVRQGTIRWDSCLDGPDIDAVRDEMIYDAWCHWTSVHDDVLEQLWTN